MKALWALTELGAVARFINGDRGQNYPSRQDRVSLGIPFINAGHLDGGRVALDNMEYITAERFTLLRSGKVEPGDILLCIRGTLGRAALVTEEVTPGAIASSLVIVRTSQDVEPRFLMSYLVSPVGQHQIASLDNGAAQPNVGANELARMRIPLPPLAIQRKVAAILSAYNDLIDNNNRRIRIAEEIAQRIYCEWFVHYRYPGHEAVPLVDSERGLIPEGWGVAPISRSATYISRGVTPKYADDGSGLVVNQKCIRGGQLDLSLARRHATIVPSEKVVRSGDMLINSTGVGTLGRVAQALDVPTGVTVDSHVTILRGDSRVVTMSYWGMALLSRQADFESMGAGSTGQTELPRGRIADLPLLIPTMDVQDGFHNVIANTRRLTLQLAATNECLRQSRDLLLPRLISGAIDVDHLDIPTGEVAA
jgi:type I restriction enzyme S subunit